MLIQIDSKTSSPLDDSKTFYVCCTYPVESSVTAYVSDVLNFIQDLEWDDDTAVHIEHLISFEDGFRTDLLQVTVPEAPIEDALVVAVLGNWASPLVQMETLIEVTRDHIKKYGGESCNLTSTDLGYAFTIKNGDLTPLKETFKNSIPKKEIH